MNCNRSPRKLLTDNNDNRITFLNMMKINFKFLIQFVGLLAFQSKAHSQKPDYSGTWKINL